MNINELQTERNSEGFVVLMALPVFLAMLLIGTTAVGYLSYTMNVMAYHNKMIQAYSVLEDDTIDWQKQVFPESWNRSEATEYEKVLSIKNVGPYVLLIKEFRDKYTGRILVNRLEFMPLGKANE